jgi:hypothetical protein
VLARLVVAEMTDVALYTPCTRSLLFKAKGQPVVNIMFALAHTCSASPAQSSAVSLRAVLPQHDITALDGLERGV